MSNMRKIINLVENQIIDEAPMSGMERKRRVSDAEFIKLAQQVLGPKAAKMTWVDIVQFADSQNVQVPGPIRMNKNLKLDVHHWNLSGLAPDEADVDKKVAKDLNIDVEPATAEDDAEIRLQNIKKVRNLVSANKLYLFGRKKGAFFRVQGAEEVLAQLERALSRELETKGDSTMDEQYNDLSERVKLVASGKSSRLKSLLLVGAPRSGKTFTVMKTIEDMGLRDGIDYFVQKGKTTEAALYRSFIEQLNGLTIFDDCDSVIKNEDSVNMLKGALDSSPIRELNYGTTRTTLNVAVLPREERDRYVEIVAKVLRMMEVSNDEYSFAKSILKKLGGLRLALKGFKQDEDDNDDDNDDIDVNEDEQERVFDYMRTKLPNKISYKGMIIFISNLQKDEWPDAIVDRAFVQEMNFKDDEMMDYIDKIKDKISTPGLTSEMKQETWEYVTDLWRTGKLKARVNFGLAFEAFDLRLTPNWKRMISQL